jgi:hypothetical protein
MAKLQYSILTRHRNRPGGFSGDGTGLLSVGLDAGNAGNPEVKLNAGAWVPLPLLNALYKYQIFWNEPDVQIGWNDIYYRDDNGERLLGSYRILNWIGNFDPGNEGCRVLVNVSPDGEVAPSTTFDFFNTTIRVRTAMISTFVLTASLNPDGVSDYKPSNSNSVTFQLATINLYISAGVLPSVFTGNSTNGCRNELARDVLFQDLASPPLQVTYNKSDVTTTGGSDGTITLNPSGGTGVYTYLWEDGPTTKDRAGLSAGTYTVTVTSGDQSIVLEIVISQPLANYFSFPQIQSLRFRKRQEPNGCSVLANFDNQMFCDFVRNSYMMYQKQYFQPVAKCDVFPIQFWSNYTNHDFELIRLSDSAIVKSYEVEQKIQLTGLTNDYNVYLVNNGNGQTRVYFSSGELPFASVGDAFNILNNPDGMNGEYVIQAIQNDILQGAQYFLINLNFTVSYPSSSALARFVSNVKDYNIFEALLDFGDVADGTYYLRAQANGTDPDVWESEPINLRVSHPKTHLLTFRNFDNSFGVVYQTGITHRMRVESQFYKAIPGGQDDNYRESNYSPVKLAGRAARKYIFEVFENPAYRHEVFSVAFRHDEVTINGVQWFSEEGYTEPKWRTRYPLANSEVTVEQVNWFDDYNGDDIGLNNEGYYKVNSGFLKVAQ